MKNPWRNIPLDLLMGVSLSEDDFKQYYLGEFKPDERFIALVDKVKSYRDKTEDCNNHDYRKYYNELRSWVSRNGYTIDEFNRAKRIVSGMR